MRTSEVFVLGTIAGGIAVWIWGRDIEQYVGGKTRGIRTKAVAGLRAIEEQTGEVLDRGGNALRGADEFLQDTKDHVSEVLRAGQKRDPPDPGYRRVMSRAGPAAGGKTPCCSWPRWRS